MLVVTIPSQYPLLFYNTKQFYSYYKRLLIITNFRKFTENIFNIFLSVGLQPQCFRKKARKQRRKEVQLVEDVSFYMFMYLFKSTAKQQH